MTPCDAYTKGLESHYSTLLDMYKNFLIFYKEVFLLLFCIQEYDNLFNPVLTGLSHSLP